MSSCNRWDGSFMGAQKLSDLGFPAIGILGTIDNDLVTQIIQ